MNAGASQPTSDTEKLIRDLTKQVLSEDPNVRTIASESLRKVFPAESVKILIDALLAAAEQMEDARKIAVATTRFQIATEKPKNFESLLLSSMDEILKIFGKTNLAIYFSKEDNQLDLGAYMNYTADGTRLLTRTLANILSRSFSTKTLPLVTHEDFRPAETLALKEQLDDFNLIACECTDFDDQIAVVVLFREKPFTKVEGAILSELSGILSTRLIDACPPDHSQEKTTTQPIKRAKNDGDWWKRGEPPPF